MASPPTPLPNDLLQALEHLADVLNQQGADYALIGALAVSIRGTIRTTRDADFLLTVPQLQLPGLLESLRERGFNIDLLQSIRDWNQEHLLDFAFGQVRVDWIKAVLPVFRRILDRAKWEEVAGRRIRVADAEGLLLMKLIAFRPRDQEDIRGILAANPGGIDLDWVRREWHELIPNDDPRKAEFERLVDESYGRPG